jgi:hypothetical protein
MREGSAAWPCAELCPHGVYELSNSVKCALDQEIRCLPKCEVSEHETRYPIDAASMRAFLEVFFTRHLFQLQNSLIDYVISPDFNEAIRSGRLRILDIGSGPAVASQALIDIIDRMMSGADSSASLRRGLLHVSHVLNDTSAICLATGKRMLTSRSQDRDRRGSTVSRSHIFTLSSAFPGNLHQICHLAAFLEGFDLVILSYVLRPLTEDGNLQSVVNGLNRLKRFGGAHGRVLIIQDKFQEPLIRKLADMMGVECREQTLTQEVYPPRGSSEAGTYTYYDCFYAPRAGAHVTETPQLERHQMRQLH